MLVIRCKVGESILVPGLDTAVTVVAVKGKKVRLGVSAPADVAVHREEVWRDESGFFVAQFADNDDLVDLERGKFNNIDPRTVGGGSTTYNGLTLGAQIKVPGIPKPFAGFMVRPEVRWDHAYRAQPYALGRDNNQVTFAVDAILTF